MTNTQFNIPDSAIQALLLEKGAHGKNVYLLGTEGGVSTHLSNWDWDEDAGIHHRRLEPPNITWTFDAMKLTITPEDLEKYKKDPDEDQKDIGPTQGVGTHSDENLGGILRGDGDFRDIGSP